MDFEFIPVLTEGDERLLDEALSQLFSYVSTDGPVWRTAAQRQRIVRDERKSHVVVRSSGCTVGAISWSPGQTPGFFRLSVSSSDDKAWTIQLIEESIRKAVSLLTRSSEVKRVELLVPTYSEVLVEYLTERDYFEVEGVLRNRFFIDGGYWPAVICCANLAAFLAGDRREPGDRQELLAALREKTLEDLTAAHDGTSWRT
ncbi:hypothetical protein AB0G60_26885 [Streptomyces angustmyceticus]|uniref:hypothetical protein n=1 Tax=Streptomyces angustmyceticus TaxID=285578 RepID=UPI000A36887A|nr:hypothetical protein [Streptomyces angustmyceticus]UAL66019.1 hypothetical protein K7396_05235 [Streptomyces angustmyceticus]